MVNFANSANNQMKSESGTTITAIGSRIDGSWRMQYIDTHLKFEFFATRYPDTEEGLAKGKPIDLLPMWKVNLVSKRNIRDSLLAEQVDEFQLDVIISQIKENITTALMNWPISSYNSEIASEVIFV